MLGNGGSERAFAATPSGVIDTCPITTALARAINVKPTPYILVDRYGRRFTNEKIKGHTVYYETTLFDSYKLDYPRIPSFWIFDQTRDLLEGRPMRPAPSVEDRFAIALDHARMARDYEPDAKGAEDSGESS